MQNSRELNSLYTPLNDLLFSYGLSEYKNFHYFDLSTLFWSNTRLFISYYRIISVVNEKEAKRIFLDSDIESFIIRMRIVLNDIAFIIRQILPEQYQGLKSPKGGVHPKNREMSINEFFKFIEKKPNDFPEFTKLFKSNEKWIFRLREERDNIIHYKSKVVIFGTEPDLSFAMINAGGTEATISTLEGGNRIITIPIFEYINSQMVSLHNFLNSDLVNTIKEYFENNNIRFQPIQTNSQMTCVGIALFKEINKI